MLIYIIEDDEAIGCTLKLYCKELFKTECVVATDLQEARTFLKKTRPDIILLDILLKGEHGWPLIEEIRKLYNPSPYIVVISAMSNIQNEIEKYKPYAYLQKPFDLDSLENLISQLNV